MLRWGRRAGRPVGRTAQPARGPWSRTRLQLLLAAVTAVGLLLAGGLGLSVWYWAVGGSLVPDPPAAAATQPVSVRDQIVAAPMASVDPQAMFRPSPALSAAATLAVPDGTGAVGPAGVPTGFPRTAAGAVAQWAAIEQTVLDQMSLPAARQVHEAWVLPGGPGFEDWSLTADVRAFLASGRQDGQAKDDTTVVVTTPKAAIVKGVDGPDWAVVCVLLDVQVSIHTDARMGYGLCAAMQWSQDRWQVATGPEPAPAPSAWPGSQQAVEAGWLTWKETP